MTTLIFLACATGSAGDGLTDELQAERDTLASELWATLEGYASWGQVDPWTGVQPSADGTHGAYVQIWLRPEAEASAGEDSAASESIIVKKGYADAAGADARTYITAMYKPTDPVAVPETGWLWLSYDDDGTNTKAEDAGGCNGCHESGDDYRRMNVDVPG